MMLPLCFARLEFAKENLFWMSCICIGVHRIVYPAGWSSWIVGKSHHPVSGRIIEDIRAHGIKISNRRATQRCNASSFFYAKICSLLARRRSSQPVQRVYWPENVIDWLGKWRPTCVMRHARGQKLQSFWRKWPFCMDIYSVPGGTEYWIICNLEVSVALFVVIYEELRFLMYVVVMDISSISDLNINLT
jgi:hypothetical protein